MTEPATHTHPVTSGGEVAGTFAGDDAHLKRTMRKVHRIQRRIPRLKARAAVSRFVAAPRLAPAIAVVRRPREARATRRHQGGRRTRRSAGGLTRQSSDDGPGEPGEPPAPAANVLREAAELVAGDRRLEYGTPVEAMRRVAVEWNRLDGRTYTARDVALHLAALKLAREAHQYKRDNLVDAAGYIAIAALCAEAEGGDR